MTGPDSRHRVQRARRTLRAAALTGAALRALAGALAALLVATLLDVLLELPAAVRELAPFTALVAGVVLLWRRTRRSGALSAGRDSAALWIEGRFPALRYALVTAVDPAYAGMVPELERHASSVPFEPEVARAARRAVLWPAFAALTGAALLLALPEGVVARLIRPHEGDALDRRVPRALANPLATVVVSITPPAYATLKRESHDNPSSVRGLVGSTVVVEGRVGDVPVTALVRERTFATSVAAARWNLSVSMPSVASALHLRAGSRERLLVLEPVVDSAPKVAITLPARDSIYRTPSGRVPLSASASDDLGLASGYFEFIVSSGAGETFTFTSGRLGAVALAGGTGALAATLSLDALGLRPGDIVHVRAVAADRNNVTGPGVGASETRTLRIARADEYDSVAVDAAPPPEPEKDALSQRMLLLLAQALHQKRPRLARADVVRESRGLAVDQARLRRRVGEIVFTRLGESSAEEGDALEKRLATPVNPDSVLAAAERATAGLSGAALEGREDETPLVAINKPLLQAFNYMWSAGSELEIGEPGKAIPWMMKALDALETARAAERIYLRGRVRTVVVDIERVRLAGRDNGSPSARVRRAALDPARAARLARFDALLALAPFAPAAVADSLLLLRLDLLDRDVVAARSLDAAANALRVAQSATGNATEVLARARRALTGAPARPGALTAWGSWTMPQ